MAEPRAGRDSGCSHCGLPLPAGVDIARTAADGRVARYCCHGCLALARMSGFAAGTIAASTAVVVSGADKRGAAGAGPYGDASRDARRAVGAGKFAVVAGAGAGSGARARPVESTLAIAGVHCAACVTTIRRRVSALPGIESIDVRLPDGRAHVTFDPSAVTLDDIQATIAAAGYRASPSPFVDEAARRRQARRALFGLFVAGFSMMQVMMYAFPVYVTDDGIAPGHLDLLRWASLVLTIPVVVYSAAPFFAGAWRDLFNRALGMDVPVALGIAAAFAASAWATWTGVGDVYFDSVTMFVFLLLGSRYLELRARQKAGGAADALLRLQPEVAVRMTAPANARNDGARCGREIVRVASLAPGDRIVVQPGDVIPTDARVEAGSATVSESILTGESAAVVRQAGASLLAGSTLYCAEPGGELVAVVETKPDDTRLAGMIRLLDRALSEKPRLGRLADRIAAWFTTALLVLAAATALGWWAIDPSRILVVTVAVLVVSCPCALSLATPSVMAAATGVLARRGLLVLDGRALETLARATHVVFDKTGTLTSGETVLERTVALSSLDADGSLAIASSLEAESRHPAGLALRRAAPAASPAASVVRRSGFGVEGVVDGRRYRLGAPEFVAGLHRQPLPPIESRPDQAIVLLGDEQGWIACFLIADALRDGARTLVRNLRELGLGVSMLTGDRIEAARHWSRQLGIDSIEGDATPARKRDAIEALQRRGEIVVMVGDGANDVAALGLAHASIAVGGGARLTAASGPGPAGMIWLGSDLHQLDWAIAKARSAMRIIRQNLAWAFFYNVTAIPLAVAGWLTPWQAGLGMSMSSLLVVLNALRVLRDDGTPSIVRTGGVDPLTLPVTIPAPTPARA